MKLEPGVVESTHHEQIAVIERNRPYTDLDLSGTRFRGKMVRGL
jgi:hypothetical protein